MNKGELVSRDAVIATIGTMYERCDTGDITDYRDLMLESVKVLPSADRTQGDVDAVAIFEREMHNLEQGYITIGEFDERIEPLRHLCYGRPQGEWIDTGKDPDHSHPLTAIWYRCSECGDGTNTKTNYCPSCGAHIKGADNEH